MSTQKQVLLKNSPRGWVQPSDMEVASTPFDLAAVGNNAGDIVLENIVFSIDPYMSSALAMPTE
jgi:NADPH-dependent curcumin reductase CurA